MKNLLCFLSIMLLSFNSYSLYNENEKKEYSLKDFKYEMLGTKIPENIISDYVSYHDENHKFSPFELVAVPRTGGSVTYGYILSISHSSSDKYKSYVLVVDTKNALKTLSSHRIGEFKGKPNIKDLVIEGAEKQK